MRASDSMSFIDADKGNDDLILVDDNDIEIGFKEKIACHVGAGVLHRAFSVFIFNSKGELLIQKRADGKMLWHGFWSNSCCSHPRRGEDIEDAASRRIVEELGIACSLEYVYKFKYVANFSSKVSNGNDSADPDNSGDSYSIGSEREVCSVFIGRCDDKVVVDSDEISDFCWISIENLLQDISLNSEKYTPWFRMEIEELKKIGEI